jgi:hypothetical protein
MGILKNEKVGWLFTCGIVVLVCLALWSFTCNISYKKNFDRPKVWLLIFYLYVIQKSL